jgi:hypothetical protein
MLLLTRVGIPPTVRMFAGVLGGLIALLVGWPCFCLSGHYYAIATVVVCEISYRLALNWDWIGGATGINIPYVRSVGDSWLWLQFRIDKLPYHYAALVFAVVVGANGAGKSTLLKSIAELVTTEGTIEFKGQSVRRLPAHRITWLGVPMVPEGRRLFPRLSDEDNLRPSALREARRRSAQAAGAGSLVIPAPAGASGAARKRCPVVSSRCWRSPTAPMYCRPAASYCPVRPHRSWRTMRCARPIWGFERCMC